MQKLLLCFFLFIPCHLLAQPGGRDVVKNINDYSPQDNNGAFNEYHYIIDSTSDFSKLKNLPKPSSINLIVRVKVLAKEIHFLGDSVTKISISCQYRQATDISSLGQLKNLRVISVSGNIDTLSLRQLHNLTSVGFTFYPGTDLPDLRQLTKLRSLTISGGKIKHIAAVSNCKSLTELSLYQLDSLKALDVDMSTMNLETLSISTCYFLKSIRGISGCRTLKELTLSVLEPLRTLDLDMSGTNLEKLTISNCFSLMDISAISGSGSLKALALIDLDSLKVLNFDMSKMNLESLDIEGGGYYGTPLKDISGILTCQSLKTLTIAGMDSLATLDFRLRKMKLTELVISRCKSLKTISGLSGCRSLTNLAIIDNPRLIEIPDLKTEFPFIEQVFVFNNKSLRIPNYEYYSGSPHRHWSMINNAAL